MRDRINIASVEDTVRFDSFLDEWLVSLSPDQVLMLDVSDETSDYARSVKIVSDRIHNLLSTSGARKATA